MQTIERTHRTDTINISSEFLFKVKVIISKATLNGARAIHTFIPTYVTKLLTNLISCDKHTLESKTFNKFNNIKHSSYVSLKWIDMRKN